MSDHDLRADALLSLTGTTPETARDAALFITGNARNAEDARLLLEACGLIPAGDSPRRDFWGKPKGAP